MQSISALRMKKMLLQPSTCPSCFQVISDPICTDCLTQHLVYWMNDNFKSKLAKDVILNNIKNILKNESMNMDKCILCGKDAIHLCSYCFSSKISFALTELNIPEKIVNDFEFMFVDKSIIAQETEPTILHKKM